jgi:uncharacterized protein
VKGAAPLPLAKRRCLMHPAPGGERHVPKISTLFPLSRRHAAAGLIAALLTGQTMTSAGLFAGTEAESLLNAAALGDADAVARLIGIGVPVDSRDASGRTALLLATHGDHIETARILIEAGADVNARDRISDSPFLYAGAEGRDEILKLTLAHGADLKSLNRFGGTALIPACHHGHIEAVYALLKTGIDIDHVNNLGWSALLEAVILGDGSPPYVEIVEALVNSGAKVALADRDGKTALMHAKARGFAEIAAILARKYQADGKP